jgi:hypothetical protein
MAAEANPDLLTRMPDKRFTWTTEPLDLSGTWVSFATRTDTNWTRRSSAEMDDHT